jgi:hypothetical protein
MYSITRKIRADIVELTDVGVVESGDSVGFAFEAFGKLGVGDFDGNGAVETGIAGLPDLAHAAPAERGEKLVGTEFLAGRGHWAIVLCRSPVFCAATGDPHR